jgi:hypothetical protein
VEFNVSLDIQNKLLYRPHQANNMEGIMNASYSLTPFTICKEGLLHLTAHCSLSQQCDVISISNCPNTLPAIMLAANNLDMPFTINDGTHTIWKKCIEF